MRRYSKLSWIVCIALLTCGTAGVATAQNAEKEEAGKEAAQEWLALLDNNDYEQTWDTASKLLQAQITKEQWAQQVRAAHASLDSLQSRSLITARYTDSLPNAPEGEYVVAQYRARYGPQEAVETVTLMAEDDAWKVAGYFVRPQQGPSVE